MPQMITVELVHRIIEVILIDNVVATKHAIRFMADQFLSSISVNPRANKIVKATQLVNFGGT